MLRKFKKITSSPQLPPFQKRILSAPSRMENFNSKFYDWVPMIYMTANISINMVIFVRLYNTRKFFVQKKYDIRRQLLFQQTPPATAPLSRHLIDHHRQFLRYNPSRAVTKRVSRKSLMYFSIFQRHERINHHVFFFSFFF